MSQHQAIIIGGGLVGGLTALLLAKAGIQATVLDASARLDEQQVVDRTDPRVLAINQASMRLMQHAGIWQHVQRYQPYSGMQVWNIDGMGEMMFGQASARQPLAHDWLGCMVEPAILNLAIQMEIQNQIQDYRTQVRVTALERLPKLWRVTLASGEQLETPLVVGADGGNSFVRQQAGIGLDILNYRQTAISCAIRTQNPHQHVARQIFLPTGPLAFLPMKSKQDEQQGQWQSVVWTLPEDWADEYQQLSDDEFKQKLPQASHYMLGEVEEVISRAAFPLIARQAEHYVKEGLALVGDAAHVIHPLAGQGVNLGCLDAAVLVDCLVKDQQRGVWAHLQTLRQYEHKRRLHNSMMMHSMSALGWLNAAQIKPLKWLRSEGMQFVATKPNLVEFFNQQASGLSVLQQTRYI